MSDAILPPLDSFALPAPPAYFAMDVAQALQTQPPTQEWLVEGLIPLGVPGIVVAKPGCGKSQISLDLALRVALGLSSLGAEKGAPPRSAIYLSMEDPQDEMHRRLDRALGPVCSHFNYRQAVNLIPGRLKILLPDHCLGSEALSLARNRQLLVSAAKEFDVPCGVIVLDTQNALFPGEENSSRDTGNFWGECQALAYETKSTVLVLHHLRKGSERSEAKSLADRLSPENLRGSSAIEGRARFVLVATPLAVGEADSVGLDVAQAHREDLVVLAAAKVNGGPKGHWFLLERPLDSRDGILRLHPDSGTLCERLQRQGWDKGSGRKGVKTFAWKVLYGIALAGGLTRMNEGLLMALLWPNRETMVQQFQKQINLLRKEGYLDRDNPTPKGIAWLKELSEGDPA